MAERTACGDGRRSLSTRLRGAGTSGAGRPRPRATGPWLCGAGLPRRAAPGREAGPAAVLAGRAAGQLQEDVVQGGPAQPDVADADLGPAQPGRRLLHQLEPV